MLTRAHLLVVVNLAVVGLGCDDGGDLVERHAQALWLNPPAGNCIGEQPANTLRLRKNAGSDQCLQFGNNIEISNLGFYSWPVGGSLNDTTNYMVTLVSTPGRCQLLQAFSESDFWGTHWLHQKCNTGQSGGSWNTWLINPGNLGGGASSLRYETWD